MATHKNGHITRCVAIIYFLFLSTRESAVESVTTESTTTATSGVTTATTATIPPATTTATPTQLLAITESTTTATSGVTTASVQDTTTITDTTTILPVTTTSTTTESSTLSSTAWHTTVATQQSTTDTASTPATSTGLPPSTSTSFSTGAQTGSVTQQTSIDPTTDTTTIQLVSTMSATTESSTLSSTARQTTVATQQSTTDSTTETVTETATTKTYTLSSGYPDTSTQVPVTTATSPGTSEPVPTVEQTRSVTQETSTVYPCCSDFERWTEPVRNLRVKEDTAVGATIGSLPARVCGIEGQEDDVSFRDTGVFLEKVLNPDVTAQYDFNVSFCDCPNFSHSVTVHVDRVFAPEFGAGNLLDLVEGTQQDTVVGGFPALDGDTCAENVTYQILSQSVGLYLSIGQFGVVRIRRRMWLQDLVDNGIIPNTAERSFIFDISASDGSHSTTKAIRATVISPLTRALTYVQKQASIRENLPPGTFVANIFDLLGGQYNALSIVQTSRQDLFGVDDTSGNVTSKVAFDRESTAIYTVLLEVDPAGPEEKFGLELVVIIDDENDGYPEFGLPSYTCRLPENSASIQGLVITVSDTDNGNNATVDLSISGTYQSLFSASKIEGSSSFNAFNIDVLRPSELNYEKTERISVNLTASDGSAEPKTNTAELTIDLLDVNDHPPDFGSSSFHVTIVDLRDEFTYPASDRDKSENSAVSYFLLSGARGRVSLDKDTATMKLKPEVRLPTEFTYSLLAKDNGIPSLSSVVEVTVNVTADAVNNAVFYNPQFDPMFYEIRVNEIRRPSLAVTAGDPDKPNFTRYLYTLGTFLQGNSSKVTISPTTGSVDFSSNADYEIPEERFFLFTVLAQADGVPSATATATVFIEILDNNDEIPVFTQNEYQTFAFTGSALNYTILYVRATDKDTNILSYSLGSGPDSGFFAIDSNTGLIRKASPDDFDNRRYSFTVVAFDGTNRATANVTVEPSTGGNISDPTPLVISVPETTAVNDTIRVLPLQLYQPYPRRFSFDVFELVFENQSATALYLREPLDRETQSIYSTLVYLHDFGTENMYDLMINVTDVNDNPPRCAKPYYRVLIPAGQGVSDRTIEVTDPDTPPFSSWSASLSQYDSIFRFLRGQIWLITERTNLHASSYEFLILLVDDNDPVLTSNCTIHVEVEGVNSIRLTNLPSSLLLSEDLPIGAVVETAVATPSDPQNTGFTITYTLTGDTRYLTIDPLSGEITVNSTLDYETDRDFAVTVGAIDSQGVVLDTADVSVQVEDYNDNVPVFDKGSYFAEIREDPELGDVILTVSAADDDTGPAGDVNYEIEGCGVSYFAIDHRTGEVTLETPLELVYYPNISFVVVATDNGNDYRRESRTVVTVTIPNFNTHPPMFTYSSSSISNITVAEESSSGYVFTVKAFDTDINDTVEYSLAESEYSDYFELNPKTGEIRIARLLDREEIVENFRANQKLSRRRREAENECVSQKEDTIALSITATDSGVPRRSDHICLFFKVLDVNDHRPKFNVTDVYIYFTQGIGRGTLQELDIEAEDADTGSHSEVYYLVSSRSDYFKIRQQGTSRPEIEATKTCDKCVRCAEYELEQITVYAYNKGDLFEESRDASQFLTVHLMLPSGERCGLSAEVIAAIALSCVLFVALCLLFCVFIRQYKRHKLYKEGTDNRNLKKLRKANETTFAPDETYIQPDDELPRGEESREGYITPVSGPNGQPSGNSVPQSDLGYGSQDSMMGYYPRRAPMLQYARRPPTHGYVTPMSSGYSNRVSRLSD